MDISLGWSLVGTHNRVRLVVYRRAGLCSILQSRTRVLEYCRLGMDISLARVVPTMGTTLARPQ